MSWYLARRYREENIIWRGSEWLSITHRHSRIGTLTLWFMIRTVLRNAGDGGSPTCVIPGGRCSNTVQVPRLWTWSRWVWKNIPIPISFTEQKIQCPPCTFLPFLFFSKEIRNLIMQRIPRNKPYIPSPRGQKNSTFYEHPWIHSKTRQNLSFVKNANLKIRGSSLTQKSPQFQQESAEMVVIENNPRS